MKLFNSSIIQPSQEPLWVVGCGDIGRRLAQYTEGERMYGLVSSTSSADLCQALSIDATVCELNSDCNSSSHSSHTTLASYCSRIQGGDVFYFIPPSVKEDQGEFISIFLDQLKTGQIRRMVLLSTTGVYGDCAGAWIDESSPLSPSAARAGRRYKVEQLAIESSQRLSFELVILRVAGIYAKDRLPLQRLKQQLPMVNREASPWTNRIHADDLAQIALAAMQIDMDKQYDIFNVCDGKPLKMADYFDQIADYAGLARPSKISFKQAEKTLSVGMLSYLRESRRIRNDKMVEQLGVTLQYPSLEEALTLFAQEE